MNMKILEEIFEEAYKVRARYVAVKVEISMAGNVSEEIIINQLENIKEKLNYYKNAYNSNLTLKTYNGIKIVDCAYGDEFNDIEDWLMF